jgi:hypothetical protein
MADHRRSLAKSLTIWATESCAPNLRGRERKAWAFIWQTAKSSSSWAARLVTGPCGRLQRNEQQ